MVSDTPTDDRCNYEYTPGDDYKHNSGYCEGHPMDNDRCYHHGGKHENGGAPNDNDNAYKHGAFSEHFRSDLEPHEIESMDALMDHLSAIDDERTLAAEVAAEALQKYKRSADSRFLREARQWVSEFNLLPNEDITELRGEGGGGILIQLDDE